MIKKEPLPRRDPLVITFINMYQNIGYKVLLSTVVCKVLYGLYSNLILSDKDFLPIEKLPLAEKNKYWEIAKIYHTDQPSAIKASKVAYILDLSTNSA